jgi:hypothetical protein
MAEGDQAEGLAEVPATLSRFCGSTAGPSGAEPQARGGPVPMAAGAGRTRIRPMKGRR